MVVACLGSRRTGASGRVRVGRWRVALLEAWMTQSWVLDPDYILKSPESLKKKKQCLAPPQAHERMSLDTRIFKYALILLTQG